MKGNTMALKYSRWSKINGTSLYRTNAPYDIEADDVREMLFLLRRHSRIWVGEHTTQVLYAMIDHLRRQGEATPDVSFFMSQRSMVLDTNLSMPTVHRAIQKLVSLGWIVVETSPKMGEADSYVFTKSLKALKKLFPQRSHHEEINYLKTNNNYPNTESSSSLFSSDKESNKNNYPWVVVATRWENAPIDSELPFLQVMILDLIHRGVTSTRDLASILVERGCSQSSVYRHLKELNDKGQFAFQMDDKTWRTTLDGEWADIKKDWAAVQKIQKRVHYDRLAYGLRFATPERVEKYRSEAEDPHPKIVRKSKLRHLIDLVRPVLVEGWWVNLVTRRIVKGYQFPSTVQETVQERSTAPFSPSVALSPTLALEAPEMALAQAHTAPPAPQYKSIPSGMPEWG